ncbi:MAG: thiamine-phosphate kinase [Nitrospiraceae bacterium]|nr:thiamine-phosphate kinase [Nitrospiraceae bacterium]
MRLSDKGELPLLEALRKKFGKSSRGLLLGIGDDAAVIRPAGRNMLLTTDMMVEGVHFDLAWTTPFQLGFKLVSVNVSDIYAMGGRPEYFLLNFAAPGRFKLDAFDSFFLGIGEALREYGVSLIGGDISSADRMMLSATVTGTASRFVTRGTARPGDGVFVTGTLGDSAGGLLFLKMMKRSVEIEKGRKTSFGPGWKTVGPLIEKHLMPRPRHPGRIMKHATAMMDVSDGLFIDLSRLCRESGVGARIYEELIPVSDELKEAAAFLGVAAIDLATGGGEDYELLFTAPVNDKVKAFRIGEITHKGLRIVGKTGTTKKISPEGYRHFVL